MPETKLIMPETAHASELSLSLMESLVPHAGAAGGCLVWLACDGAIQHHDSQAGEFYNKFVLSGLRQNRTEISSHIAALTTHCQAASWPILPGINLVAAPITHRRQ